MSAKATASGHAVKHTKTSKAAKKTAKHRPNHHKLPATHKATGHKVTAKATHAKHAKAVGFGVGDLLPVCAFEAVAMSLRLAGQPVSDDDVCGLWHLLGEPAEGVPVGEALAAAALFGLGGHRPVAAARDGLGSFARSERDASELDLGNVNRRHEADDRGLQRHRQPGDFVRLDRARFPLNLAHGLRVPLAESEPAHALANLLLGDVEAGASGPDVRCENTRIVRHEPESSTAHLILSVDVPGPHAVLATADGWWSWGELHDPWPCRVSEAWAVSWS